MSCLFRCGFAAARCLEPCRSVLWGGTAGLAMVCPITLSGKAAKRNYGKHESPRCAARRTPHIGAVTAWRRLATATICCRRRNSLLGVHRHVLWQHGLAAEELHGLGVGRDIDPGGLSQD